MADAPPAGAVGAAAGVTGRAAGAAGRYSAPFWPQAAEPRTSPRLRTQAPARIQGRDGLATLRALFIREILETMSHAAAPLTDAEFHRLSAATFARIEARIDAWLDEDVVDIDTHRTGGLLELTLPDRSKLILNTQPPLHEIWLAAKGGGFHFRWDGQAWVDTRSGDEFFGVLSRHASAQAGRPLDFAA
jgi:CyaY protein